MLLKDISFLTPQENILYDEVLLSLAEAKEMGEVLRFWESSQPFIVLGKICKEEDDLKIREVLEDQISVVRRSSGGGTVVQGKGCLNFSLILAKQRPEIMDLRKSYAFILNKIVDALRSANIICEFLPICDIALSQNHKKISGNAQKRGKNFVLHHGTILYQFDLKIIERYLKIPKDTPIYREGRSHLDFVANVPLSASKIKELFKKAFAVTQEENYLTLKEQDSLQSLVKTKDISINLNLATVFS